MQRLKCEVNVPSPFFEVRIQLLYRLLSESSLLEITTLRVFISRNLSML